MMLLMIFFYMKIKLETHQIWYDSGSYRDDFFCDCLSSYKLMIVGVRLSCPGYLVR